MASKAPQSNRVLFISEAINAINNRFTEIKPADVNMSEVGNAKQRHKIASGTGGESTIDNINGEDAGVQLASCSVVPDNCASSESSGWKNVL